MSPLCGALALVFGLAACTSDKSPDKPASQDALTVDVGQCMLVAEDVEADVSKLPIISCAKAHTHEIFGTYLDTEDDVFPGVTTLVTIAKRECYKQFEDFVGISPFDSSLQITWIVPGLDGWNGKDKDREILCVLRPTDGSQLTGTAKGSKL